MGDLQARVMEELGRFRVGVGGYLSCVGWWRGWLAIKSDYYCAAGGGWRSFGRLCVSEDVAVPGGPLYILVR